MVDFPLPSIAMFDVQRVNIAVNWLFMFWAYNLQ